jgi:energy-converting hydrogenase Eha subunit E
MTDEMQNEEPVVSAIQDEKVEEKTEEKTSEKQQEKTWDEKVRRDPLGSVLWALILIWAGIVLLADNLNLLPQVGFLDELDAWSYVFLGGSAIVLVGVLIRLIVPAMRRPIIGSLVFAFVLLGVGLGRVFDSTGVTWAVILIALGTIMLLGGIFRRR